MKRLGWLLAALIPVSVAQAASPVEAPPFEAPQIQAPPVQAPPIGNPDTRVMLPGVKTLMQRAPKPGGFAQLTDWAPRLAPQAVGSGFWVPEKWPIFAAGNPCNGGMLVDMDGDPELEYVVVTMGIARALNPDGTSVPGWPVAMSDSTFSAPAFGDIDGDGDDEVVIHTFFFGVGGQVYAYHTDGTLVSGFPRGFGGTVKGPTLADLDDNGTQEIVSVQNVSGQGNLYVLGSDGSVLSGWPALLDDVGGSSASVGNIDGVEGLEIVAVSFRSLYVFDTKGVVVPGFPFTPGENHTFNYNSPVLADLDKDGDREIVVCTSREDGLEGRAYVIHHDGTIADGWPKPLTYPCFIPASVVDLDGDGWLDVLTGDVTLSPTPVNTVYAWDRLGNPLPGFPVLNQEALHGQIIVADLDDDENLEIVYDENTGGGNYVGRNHDGTALSGFPLSVLGSSFLGCLTVEDIDRNGTLDLAGTGLLIAAGDCQLYQWNSDLPFSRSRAPLPTYQYNVRRDGVADPDPIPDLKANDLDGPLTVTTADPVEVTLALDPASRDGDQADWWIQVENESGRIWWAEYRPGQNPRWTRSVEPIRFVGTRLRSVNRYRLVPSRTLPAGTWTFRFAVDGNRDNVFDGTFIDEVTLTVE